MMSLRKSSDRGHADHGWLDTYHTFSFGGYRDPKHTSFRALRVINEDRVKPGYGFPTHGHDNMEIVTYVVAGELEHKDSLGTGSTIRPGDVQRMSAGRGVEHSEFNPSKTENVHLLQIWLFPEKRGLEPSYEQRSFPANERGGRARLVASRDGAEGSVRINQDVRLYTSLLSPKERVELPLAPGRHAWVQLIKGELDVNGVPLSPGDGLSASEEPKLSIEARQASEFIVFDLA